MSSGRSLRRVLASLAGIVVVAWPGIRAATTAPDRGCPPLGSAPGSMGGERLHRGMLLDHDRLLHLQELFPAEVWRLRGVFFHEGMTLEVGPCHRVYAPAAAYDAATRRSAGSASIDTEGNLRGYTAGLPFPPETIDPSAQDAGVRWAWNLERRHRGPGLQGRFRLPAGGDILDGE